VDRDLNSYSGKGKQMALVGAGYQKMCPSLREKKRSCSPFLREKGGGGGRRRLSKGRGQAKAYSFFAEGEVLA